MKETYIVEMYPHSIGGYAQLYTVPANSATEAEEKLMEKITDDVRRAKKEARFPKLRALAYRKRPILKTYIINDDKIECIGEPTY